MGWCSARGIFQRICAASAYNSKLSSFNVATRKQGGILGESCSVSKFFEEDPKISVVGLSPSPPSAPPLLQSPSSALSEEDDGRGK